MWLRKCMIKKTSWISDLFVFKTQCICSSLNHIKAKGYLSCEDYISKGTRLDLKAKSPSLSFVPYIQVSTLVQTYQYHYHPFWCLLLRLFRVFFRRFSWSFFLGITNPRVRSKRSQQTINNKILIVKSRLESIERIVLCALHLGQHSSNLPIPLSSIQVPFASAVSVFSPSVFLLFFFVSQIPELGPKDHSKQSTTKQ